MKIIISSHRDATSNVPWILISDIKLQSKYVSSIHTVLFNSVEFPLVMSIQYSSVVECIHLCLSVAPVCLQRRQKWTDYKRYGMRHQNTNFLA